MYVKIQAMMKKTIAYKTLGVGGTHDFKVWCQKIYIKSKNFLKNLHCALNFEGCTMNPLNPQENKS